MQRGLVYSAWLVALTLVVSCDDGSESPVDLSDASDRVGAETDAELEETDSETEADAQADAEAEPAEDASDGSQPGAARSDAAAPQSRADAGTTVLDAATAADAAAQGDTGVVVADAAVPDAGDDADADEEDSGPRVVYPFGPFGELCHKDDANGPLTGSRLVSTAWAAPAGGEIPPGTYVLLEELRRVNPGATDLQIEECTAYSGEYRETLRFVGEQLSQVTYSPGVTRRLIYRYTRAGTTLSLTQTCPVAAPAVNWPYSVLTTSSGTELWTYDEVVPGVASPCQYLYRYKLTN